MSAWRNVLTEKEIGSVVDYVLDRLQKQGRLDNDAALASGPSDRVQGAK
jgi:hypothetical protein